jgi:hypothetical protein
LRKQNEPGQEQSGGGHANPFLAAKKSKISLDFFPQPVEVLPRQLKPKEKL